MNIKKCRLHLTFGPPTNERYLYFGADGDPWGAFGTVPVHGDSILFDDEADIVVDRRFFHLPSETLTLFCNDESWQPDEKGLALVTERVVRLGWREWSGDWE